MIAAVETVKVPTGDAYPARADVYHPTSGVAGGVVLLVHGFKGYKTWGFLPYLARRLAGANLLSVVLDLSHNGTFPAPDGEPVRPYVRPDLFERNTLGREVSDVAATIEWLTEGLVTNQGRPGIGLFAHSRGSVAAVVNAIEKRAACCLCTWSAAADPDHHTTRQKERWRTNGYYEFVLAHGGQRLRMGIDYLNDLEKNAARYRTGDRVAELRIPHLIVHGRLDMAVAPSDAWVLFEAETRSPDRRCLLVRTGHTFGVDERSPLRGDPPRVLSQAADETVRWFVAHLTEEGSA